MSKQVGDVSFFYVEEVAEMLYVGTPTIRKYLREGRLKGTNPAKRWYVSEDSLKDYFIPEPSEDQLEED